MQLLPYENSLNQCILPAILNAYQVKPIPCLLHLAMLSLTFHCPSSKLQLRHFNAINVY